MDGLTAAGVSAGIVLLSSMATSQKFVREQLTPLAEVDHMVGRHCTVLPIVLKLRPVEAAGNQVWLAYEPYFQSSSRLELTGDRVVLFNFLARLDAYPVHFRPNVEPQANIFHWSPRQEKTIVETIDVDGFEKGSGMQIDYILLWGDLKTASEGQSQQILNAISQFSVVYRSPDGAVSLYAHRERSKNSLCVAPDSIREPALAGR